MIDQILVWSVVVAFAVTVAAILRSRRASERPRDDDVERGEPSERRYVNGGWH